MKILHVISDENIGGAGVLLCNLLRHFDREEVKSVVALPKGSALRRRLHEMDVETVGLEYPCDRLSPSSVREISCVIRFTEAELLHANAALSARVAARRCGIPVLHTRHCCFPPTGLLRIPPLRWLMGSCNRALSDCVIATAEAAAENLRALGIRESRLRIIINGSDQVRTVGDRELEAVRRRYGLTPRDFTVGMCARLEPCKGQDTFLRAAEWIARRTPAAPIRFLLIGDGSMRERLEQEVKSRGLSDRVIFTGFLEDVTPIYRLLRINVNCSRGTETSCLALSEGMSAGVPMIASNYGGNPFMVGEDGAGFLFPVGDHLALAALILRIYGNPSLEASMRQAALSRYERLFTASRMAERVTEVYREMLQGQGSHTADAVAR